MELNYSKAIFLVNDDVRAIRVNYDPKDPNNLRTVKTLDVDIAPGDLVVVPTETRHNYTVVRVEEVDVDVDDYEDTEDILWVVTKLDTGAHEKLLKKEQDMVKTMRSAQRRKKREELAAAIFEDQEELKKLQLLGSSDTE